MTIYLAGSEMGTFIPSDATAYEATSKHNTAFTRAAVSATSGDGYCESIEFGDRTDFYLHGAMATEGYPSGSVTMLTMVSDADVEAIKILYNRGTQLVTVQYHNGTTYVTAGTLTVNMETVQDVDMHVVCNSGSGSFEMWFSGTKRVDATGLNLASTAAINKVRVYGANYAPRLSQFIASNEPMIGWRLATYYPSGAGSDTAFNGSYTGIDEAVFNDADFINSDTANDVSTFTLTGPALTGYVVRAVAVTARAKCGLSGPQNIQMVLRSGGANYVGDTEAVDVGYGGYCHVWETDPATSAAWQNSAIASIQAGVKAIA
jgi:hypothetical protein